MPVTPVIEERFMLRSISVVAVCLLAVVPVAVGQEGRADVAVGGMAIFTKDTSGKGLDQSVTNSGGILGSFRYQFRRNAEIELNYGYTRNSQIYTNGSAFTFQEQQANVHELTAAYVYQLNRKKKLSPFVLGGGGLLLFRPISTSTHSLVDAGTDTEGTFLLGVGANYRLTDSLGLRFQFRGLMYKAPDFGVAAASTGSWMLTGEPSVGVTLRF
jgi:opacity protein-like surface antigen